MQLELQHADPQADPHDAIVAQLRKLAPRLAHASAEIDATPAASQEPASEPLSVDTPLNDNSDNVSNPIPRAWTGGAALLAFCAGIAATLAWHSYGEEAKQKLSHFMPQLLAGVLAPTQSASGVKPQDATSQIAATQPAADPAPAQEAGATPASASPTQPAPATPAADTSSAQAAPSPEVTQSMEAMARDIASLKQTVEQLQTGQQQLSRDIAKVTEHEARRKPGAQAAKPASSQRPQRALGVPPHPLGTLAPASPSSATLPAQAYPQGGQRDAYIPPSAPTQLPPQPGDTSVLRPPAPLR